MGEPVLLGAGSHPDNSRLAAEPTSRPAAFTT